MVWIIGLNGPPVPVDIQTGVRNEDRTEVIPDPLRAGELVIVGVAQSSGERRFLGLNLGF
jgi:hypothetical protein